MSVIFETSIGEFTVDLFCEERPKCCLNFLKLCKIKYYNYCLFHSIQERLVAQTGDPSGSGNGGYSVWQQLSGVKYFQNELKPKIKHYKSGLLSMINNGSNMHGSQFCITLAENLDYLDGKHTVFGEIVEGLEIIKKLNEVFVDKSNVPLQDVRIYHTIIVDDPFEDPKNLVFPEMSPEPREDQLDSGRVGAEEDLTMKSSATAEELAQLERLKEARSNVQILTVIGDIPDEDIKPPDNVLFVCSLNPLTCSEDLELIFSRFGEIVSCEVIRDQKSGSSLQYAFIEFKDKSACEKAYYDMERVLIDDRRIHVDFSQSVSKQWQMHKSGHFKSNFLKVSKDLIINDRYESNCKKERSLSHMKSHSLRKDREHIDRVKEKNIHRQLNDYSDGTGNRFQKRDKSNECKTNRRKKDHYDDVTIEQRQRDYYKDHISPKRNRVDHEDNRRKKDRSMDRKSTHHKRDRSSEHVRKRNHSKEDRRHRRDRFEELDRPQNIKK